MLDQFRKSKQREIDLLREAMDAGRLATPEAGAMRGFAESISQPHNGAPLAIIAEFKRASPSRGIICQSVSVEAVAREYCQSGASAMSILTEQDWFGGDFSFLERAQQAMPREGRIPLLRKDFIFDPLQIINTAASPASALLLIVRLTPDSRILRDLREQAEIFGLDCVVEVFDSADLEIARESGARIIQVNARDLETLKVSRSACLNLAQKIQPDSGEIWIAASGMEKLGHLRQAADAGFHAALIGTALMANGAPGQSLRKLLAGSFSDAD